ncbi:TadE/TadG family type IV pilus assembly protein [Sphingomonas montanisoli]|uniref:Pilus assembly protein n=1 Tax=Sphingomonas montanisoli TaxID=2606412 RepID=A0A5D9CDK9_9SPHN|nr:hypothetical protein [Sphingomonas montanisoli]TZG29436.1 hypothetical protein FYJ91_04740 [Sphingomonas montanisoli]
MKSALTRWVRRLRSDRRGISTIEFALSVPLLLVAGGYGIEMTNYAIANVRVSQAALDLADHASRVGAATSLSITQLREVDVNDVLQGARIQGDAINLTTYGRVTLSSLENVKQSYDSAAVQRIHWQRCVGLARGTGYDSSYGTTSAAAGTDATQGAAGTTAVSGIGDPGFQVSAPLGAGLMFVEVNYDYQRLFGSLFMKPTKIHHVASLIVRDRRDYSQMFNPSPTAARATCNLYAA